MTDLLAPVSASASITATALAREFLLPDLGEGLEEAEVVSWLVAVGDVIAIDQLVVEVESAKSIVELPSPYGGRVEVLHAATGQVVQKGSPLITVVPVDALVASGAPVAPTASAAPGGPAAPDALAPAEGADIVPGTALRPAAASDPEPTSSGAVLVGYGTKESTVRLKRPEGGRFGNRVAAPSGSASAPSAPASASASAPNAVATPVEDELIDGSRQSPVVSPIVRKRARENGFDASHLLGSGRDGLVVRDDVEAVIRQRKTAPTTVAATGASDVATADSAPARNADALASSASASASATVVVPSVASVIGGGDVRIPITGLRKLVAARLSESRRVIPEATIWMDVDATELFTAKDRLQKSTGERFSLTALIARFAVAGLKQYPILNSSVSQDGREIIQHGSINLGLAAQTPRGLMVPVVHGAHDLTTRKLRDAIADLVTTSEKGDFAPATLSGGTFTLNNYGGFGVDGSTPIINYPEVAMLGIGRVLERPWVVDHQLAVRRVMQLSFVFDHRVCDGDVASGFLTYVARCIEEPLLLLGNV
ncbi:dihydrolipoamide acetyltransferase family protein [Subtercola lobariae]|uniref:Dihydrolipoamide acetyltransferase component of pyruvate dehydrogenase complex n=1 Tax=Subtercola lobariae TaxID=1588641 RepID=A0A917B091_9MICO|nr:dihydrolipoamide acetyltransferase family protein [Subtercola lobariae]GGF11913.1 dihydrolipoamide acetyltransferase component of pyruvate dehydrogenase complex [Subtercola lobariae]